MNPARARQLLRIGRAVRDEAGQLVGIGPQNDIAQLPGLPRCQRIEAEVRDLDTRAVGAMGRVAFNPSVCVHRDELWMSIRAEIPWRHAGLVVGRLDDDLRLRDARFVHESIAPSGLEDCRAFSFDGRLHVSGTVHGIPGNARQKIALVRLTDDARAVDSVHVQRSRRIEKNWMPCVDGDALHFVYDVNGATPIVLAWSRQTGQVEPSAWDCPPARGGVRGSSQLLPYGDGWIAIVHECALDRGRSGDQRCYLHRFARFDRELQTVQLGRRFLFTKIGIEFACGAAWWRDRLVVSFGIDDRRCALAVVNPAIVEAMLAPAVEHVAPTAVAPVQSAQPETFEACAPTAVARHTRSVAARRRAARVRGGT